MRQRKKKCQRRLQAGRLVDMESASWISLQRFKDVHKDESKTSRIDVAFQYGLDTSSSESPGAHGVKQSFWMIDAALLSQSLLEFVMSGHDWPVVMSNPSCMSNYLKLMCRARVPKIPCQSVLSNSVPNIQDPKIPRLMKCFSHFQGWGFRIFGSMDSSW